MSFIVGLLTIVTVFNALLLVLVQLPKKDAGAGMAFGAGTADALFGAGSGNALTKITKYTTGVFLGLAFLLGYLMVRTHATDNGEAFVKQINQTQQQMAHTAPAAPKLQSFQAASLAPSNAAPAAPAPVTRAAAPNPAK